MKINQINKENNVRDLGGYQSKDGRKIRKGIFFRSGGLYHLNEEELGALKDQNVKYILDLRADYEQKRHPDPIVPGTEIIQHSNTVSKFGEQIDFSPNGMHQTGEAAVEQLRKLVRYYAAMPFENEALHALMNAIEQGKTPLLFHCATGKDRTGVAAMLILCALGYDEEAAVDSYVLTNVYRRDELSALIDGHRKIMTAVPKLRLVAQFGKGVIREFGERVFSEIHQQYGTLEAYFAQEFGLDADGLAEFRARYLVAPDGPTPR